jgi:tRNA threonylcarbamoyladenosine biosynthesis protein TsaE
MKELDYSLAQIDEAVEEIFAFAKANINTKATEPNDYLKGLCIALTGEMGAGKTTLVGRILAYLNISTEVSSPTFSLVNEYSNGELKVFHFDLYRIEKLAELEEFGFSEYLDSNALTLIEWPEIAKPYFDKPVVGIHQLVRDETRRKMILTPDAFADK